MLARLRVRRHGKSRGRTGGHRPLPRNRIHGVLRFRYMPGSVTA